MLFTTAIRAGRRSGCASPDTVGHATPNGAQGGRHVRQVADRRAGRRTSASTGTGTAIADSASRRSIAALEAGATRLHGAALGIGERCGNTPIDLLLVNLVMMGYREHDLTGLPAYCQAVARACDVRIAAELSGRRRRRVPHRRPACTPPPSSRRSGRAIGR